MLISITLWFSGFFMLIELINIKRITSKFFAIIPLFFLFIMVAFNRMNRDYENYLNVFNGTYNAERLEFGYLNLINILQKYGLDHTAVVFFVGALLMLVLLKFLKTSNHINMVLFFYAAFPLIFDINQTRNTIMYLIVILSLIFIAEKQPIKHYLMLFIASSFHYFSVIYAPFYFLNKLSREKFIKTLVTTTVILGLASPILMELANKLFITFRSYYMGERPGIGIIIIFAQTALDVFTVWWIGKKINNKIEDKNKGIMEVMYRFVWYSIIILPFCFYFLEFTRIQRNALLVKYIYSAFAMRYLTIKQKLFTYFLLLLSLFLYLFLVIKNGQLELYQYLDENFIKYYLDLHLLY